MITKSGRQIACQVAEHIVVCVTAKWQANAGRECVNLDESAAWYSKKVYACFGNI